LRRISSLFLVALLVSLAFTFSSFEVPTVKSQETGSFGNSTVPEIAFANWTRFWNLFNAHTGWNLEYNNGSGWNNIKSDLQITKNYTEVWNCKITLNFTASYTADYRLTFGIDLDVKNYTHKEGSWNYTISYKNYTVYFDWSDIKEIPNLQISHGIKPVGDESYFWFRIRKDNVQQGKNVVIDPSFGCTTKTGSPLGIENRIRGSWFTCPESGTAQSITVYLDCTSSAKKAKTAIYAYVGVGDAGNIVGETEELTIAVDFDGWKTFSFSDPKPSLSADTKYFLNGWGESGSGFLNMYWTDEINKGLYKSVTYNGWESPLTGETVGDALYSIYCNYTTAAGEERTFYGTINQKFTVTSKRTWTFKRYSQINQVFSATTERIWLFNLYSTINQKFAIDSLTKFTQAGVLKLYGTINQILEVLGYTPLVPSELPWKILFFATFTFLVIGIALVIGTKLGRREPE